ncbi:MAG: hypothetical protein JNK27_00060 [Chitinophagaceae bacterium]|nr:hypothetical protein [Chitinophagaceae bacterium]
MYLNTLHIIHLERRIDRLESLFKELQLQQIIDFNIWTGFDDPDFPARGILKSHQQIVEFAKQSCLKQITIAEDDIKFTTKGAWDYYISNQPEIFDLYLGGVIWGDIEKENLVHDFSGTSLYTIHEEFYDVLLSINPGIDFDRQLAGKGLFKVCTPMVALQQSGYSDNRKQFVDFSRYTSRYHLYQG